METNQRRRTRVRFSTSATLRAGKQTLAALSTRDVSLKGLYVQTGERLPLGTEVEVLLELGGSTSSLSLKMKGRVARVEPGGLGVEFSEVDLDSFFHLRNLLSYNSEDPSAIEAELATEPAF